MSRPVTQRESQTRVKRAIHLWQLGVDTWRCDTLDLDHSRSRGVAVATYQIWPSEERVTPCEGSPLRSISSAPPRTVTTSIGSRPSPGQRAFLRTPRVAS